MSVIEKNTRFIKFASKNLGFDYCGIAKAVKLDEDARRLETWLNKGFQGKMQYMENYFDLRIDPVKLVPGAKSVITLLLNYFPSEQQIRDSRILDSCQDILIRSVQKSSSCGISIMRPLEVNTLRPLSCMSRYIAKH